MELIEWILQDENMDKAIKAVKRNKGANGIDKMTVGELDAYFALHRDEIKTQIREGKYKPNPVRRAYIPKSNGKKRPLGIPTVVDRVVQQATAQVLSLGYDKYFSEHSYGFRPNRNCQQTVEEALTYLNEGYEWVIDLDIEKYFDTVNHDKLISILRERINDAKTLRLIRQFLQARVAATDRVELAKLLNISDLQLSYITNVDAGHGLIKVGSSLVPFANKFPRDTKLYRLMTTKFGEN